MSKALQIKDFPGYYVTDTGDVYSRDYNHTGRIKKLTLLMSNRGYLQIYLYKFGKKYNKQVHRLVAEAFIPTSLNKPEVNHKNGIKTDNRAENLEWTSRSENEKHKYKVLGYKGTMHGKTGKDNKKSKTIFQMKDNKIIATFYGSYDAQRKTGIDHSGISACCLGKQKTAGGYKWRYA